MLNTFPTLLAFGLLSPFILRISLGVIFLEFGYSKISKMRSEKIQMFESLGLKPGVYYTVGFALLEIIVGLALFVGMYTQIASLIASIICILAILIKKRNNENVKSGYGFLILCFVISISLLFSGAGFLAFDLPL
jgi:uncharacterized membrane protein YphA (DoxX/SURF4 family)